MDAVNKTLYIPLYGKALVSRQGLFLRDPRAEEIWAQEQFPLSGRTASKWLAYYMGMRSAVFDGWTAAQLARHPGAMVLHLGCGLDSRVLRVAHEGHLWFDLDLPQVIAQRQRYFEEGEQDRMVSGDLCAPDWAAKLPQREAIVVLEGVTMYLGEAERTCLLRTLEDRFPKVYLLADFYSRFAAGASRYRNPIAQVGVRRVWGMDRPEEWLRGTRFFFKKAWDMTPDALIGQLDPVQRRIFHLLYAGKLAGSLYRLYEYEA